ncbi:MAG: hypothetical protein ACP5T3_03165, partial [Candidatus Micrarchaeia archaeon]
SDLFLIRPRHKSNAYKFAEKILEVKGVRKILVGEGDYGAVVETGKESAIESYLDKNKIDYSRVYCLYALRGVSNANNSNNKKA